MENRHRIILLFSIYGNLLSPKQISYMESYLNFDNTISEIAELNNVSRQAVFDNINKAIKNLEEFEKKLCVYSKYQDIVKIVKDNISNSNDILNEIDNIMLETR